jgi:hypothetical protein
MAIAFVNASTVEAAANWQTSWTVSHTVSSGANRVLVVTPQIFQGGLTVTGVTYGGTALTKVVDNTADAYYYRSSIWYMVAPPVGTADVVVTVDGAAEGAVVGAMSFTGVHQGTPFGQSNHGGGAASPGELTISSASDQLVVSSIGIYGGSGTPLADEASQDNRYNVYCDVSNTSGGSSTKVGAASTVVGYTFYSDWGMCVAALMPASARRRIIIS